MPLEPPIKGLRADLYPTEMPDGFMSDGLNVLIRDGVVLIRPGQVAIAAAPSSDPVMGGLYYQDNQLVERMVIGTTTKFFQYTGTTWSDITGSTALTGGRDQQVRFAVFPFGTTTRLLAVNDKDVPQVYTGTGTFADLAGSPPIAKDITVAFQRVILGNVTVSATRRGSSMWISGFQDPTSWNSNDEVSLPEDKGTIIAVQQLNPQLFAIYKDASQWVGIGTGGLFPFIFELRDHQPGPCSPASVIQAENFHYYLGLDGNVYRFDGNRCIAIGGWVQRVIQGDMNWINRGRTHGFYDYLNREIWWFWESQAPNSPTSGIVYRMPHDDIPGAFSTMTRYAFPISSSWNWRIVGTLTWDSLTGTWDTLPYPTWDSMLLTGRPGAVAGWVDGQVYHFGIGNGDGGSGYDAFWDFPFKPYTGVGENIRVDVVESHWRRAPLPEEVEIQLIMSDTLFDQGDPAAPQSISLVSGEKLRAIYYNQQGRYVSIRHRLANTLGSRQFRGGVLYAYKRGEG